MRYIITHTAAVDAGKPVVMLTHAAEIAETPEAAAVQFIEKHPDKIVMRVEAAPDASAAFERYGLGAWTDAEQAEHRARQAARYAVIKDEHDEAAERVRTFTADEFFAEISYKARRANEDTPNLDGVHVGDIFVACWGYDQTNYDFYQVVGLRGKHTAVVRKNATKEEMCSDWNGYTRPIRDAFEEEETHSMRTSINTYRNCPQMKVPGLLGHHTMTPAAFGELYRNSTGA